MMYNKRAAFVQIFMLIVVLLVGFYFYVNVQQHLLQDHTASGFSFLFKETRFNIIMHLIDYTPESTYLRAFLVGVINTLLLTVLTIFFASAIGLIIASARLSRNWLLAKLGSIYVAMFINIPLLLQIFFWYFIQLEYLPKAHASMHLWLDFSLSVRGLQIGNFTVIPELIAMLCALTIYSSTYIAEDIRRGILSVDNGQLEAAAVNGFSSYLTMRLIILPQAIRLIVPPLLHHYLNILKNSALGSAIGYPDLFAIFAGTAMSQSGQALETIFITMLFYIIFSILVSYLVDLFNRKMVIVKK